MAQREGEQEQEKGRIAIYKKINVNLSTNAKYLEYQFP